MPTKTLEDIRHLMSWKYHLHLGQNYTMALDRILRLGICPLLLKRLMADIGPGWRAVELVRDEEWVRVNIEPAPVP